MTDAPPPPPPNYGPPPQPYGPPPGFKLKRKKRFYQRFWLFWVPVIIVVIIIASVSASAGGGSSNNAANNPDASTTPNSGISKGIGSKDASADVKIGRLKAKKILGQVSYYYASVTVMNHSSKRSDYIITVALESADGKRQIDTATVLIQNLEAGQSKADTADFLTTDKLPKGGGKLVLQEIERTASA